MTKSKPKTIDEYIKSAPKQGQGKLHEIRAILKEVAPNATEAIKWGYPVFEEKRILFSFSAFKDHLNFMPTRSSLEPFEKELENYTTGKDTIQFPYDKPLPKELIRKIAALGYYVNKIADQGLIGLAFASAPFQTTAPHGSNEAKFCTNPLAYGIPTQNDPIILDMSTSAMAYYGLIQAKTAGQEVPEGTGYDSSGNETTNPAEVMNGALKTFGGHKGSGLALVVQILAGVFVKADSFNNDSDNAGNLVMAIDPNIFIDEKEFKAGVSEIVSKVKGARKLNGVEEIYIPGERGNNFKKNAESTGEIEIEENLLKSLREVVN